MKIEKFMPNVTNSVNPWWSMMVQIFSKMVIFVKFDQKWYSIQLDHSISIYKWIS